MIGLFTCRKPCRAWLASRVHSLPRVIQHRTIRATIWNRAVWKCISMPNNVRLCPSHVMAMHKLGVYQQQVTLPIQIFFSSLLHRRNVWPTAIILLIFQLSEWRSNALEDAFYGCFCRSYISIISSSMKFRCFLASSTFIDCFSLVYCWIIPCGGTSLGMPFRQQAWEENVETNHQNVFVVLDANPIADQTIGRIQLCMSFFRGKELNTTRDIPLIGERERQTQNEERTEREYSRQV